MVAPQGGRQPKAARQPSVDSRAVVFDQVVVDGIAPQRLDDPGLRQEGNARIAVMRTEGADRRRDHHHVPDPVIDANQDAPDARGFDLLHRPATAA